MSCKKQCCRIILGVILIFLGFLSIVGGTLALAANGFDLSDPGNEAQFYAALFGGVWSIFAGFLGCCILPCCCCCCRKTDDRCRTCLLALDFLIALFVIILALVLLWSDIKLYLEIEGKYDECKNNDDDDESDCEGQRGLFLIVVVVFLISGFEFIIGVATIISVIIKIRKWYRGELDDDDLFGGPFEVVGPSDPPHNQPHGMPPQQSYGPSAGQPYAPSGQPNVTHRQPYAPSGQPYATPAQPYVTYGQTPAAHFQPHVYYNQGAALYSGTHRGGYM